MKPKFAYAFFLLAVITLTSCSNSSSKNDITHIPVRIKDDGNWSLLDIKTGKLLYEGEFKKSPSIATEGIFITRNENGKLFYNRIENEKKFVQIAGPYIKANKFTEGIAIVCKEDDYVSAINKKGEEVFKLKPDKDVTFEQVGQCYDGMILFKDQNGYYGFLDKEGKIAIKPQYDFADDFRDGKARVSKNKDNKDILQIIDKKGNELMSPDNAYIGPVYGDMIAYSNSKDEYGVLKIGKDKEKLITASSKYEKILIDNGSIFYSSDDEWGLLDEKGEIKIRAKYRALSQLDKSRYLGLKADGSDKKYEILDGDGEVLKSQDVEEAFSLNNGNFFIMDGKDLELRDKDGEAVGNVAFKGVDDLDDFLNISTGVSSMTEAQYVDWSKITNILDELKPNSILGVATTDNCIAVEKKLAAMNSSGSSPDKNGKAKGLANSSRKIRMKGYEKQTYIGSGYKGDYEGSEEVAVEREVIAESQASMYGDTVAIPSAPIDDKAPGWETYQRSLTHEQDLGKSGRLSIEFNFDDYIKKPIQKMEPTSYYGYTYNTEKTVGYEKNEKALLDQVKIRFYFYDKPKNDKLKELLDEHFSNSAYTLAGPEIGRVKRYNDTANNTWVLTDNSITFHPANAKGLQASETVPEATRAH